MNEKREKNERKKIILLHEMSFYRHQKAPQIIRNWREKYLPFMIPEGQSI